MPWGLRGQGYPGKDNHGRISRKGISTEAWPADAGRRGGERQRLESSVQESSVPFGEI